MPGSTAVALHGGAGARPAPWLRPRARAAASCAARTRVKPFAVRSQGDRPQGAARATAACAQAETIAAQAQADAAWEQWNESFVVWLRTVRMIRDQLAEHRQARRQKRPNHTAQETDAYEQCLTKAGHIALDYLEFCQAQMATCAP